MFKVCDNIKKIKIIIDGKIQSFFSLFEKCDAAIFVYDICNFDSFNEKPDYKNRLKSKTIVV